MKDDTAAADAQRQLAQLQIDIQSTRATRTPQRQAEAAWTAGCGLSVDELQEVIRVARGAPSLAAIQRAGEILATGRAAAERMTPREQAEAAYTPPGPSVDELEQRIRRRRGIPEAQA